MRKIALLVIVATLVFSGCSLLRLGLEKGHCAKVSLVHDAGTVETKFCAGQDMKELIEKVEEETGFDIWEAVFKQVCKEVECEQESNADDETKKLLTE